MLNYQTGSYGRDAEIQVTCMAGRYHHHCIRRRFRLNSRTVLAQNQLRHFLSSMFHTVTRSAVVRPWLLFASIVITSGINVPANLDPEGYVLAVNANEVLVAGKTEAGTFYGLQTLKQLVTAKAHTC
jgi:hexosaminidase